MDGKMTKMQVIRDKDGSIINIGPWDYRLEWQQATRKDKVPVEAEDGSYTEAEIDVLVYKQAEGAPEGTVVPVMRQVMLNPLPEGAYEDKADIITGTDGGLYEKGDPRAG